MPGDSYWVFLLIAQAKASGRYVKIYYLRKKKQYTSLERGLGAYNDDLRRPDNLFTSAIVVGMYYAYHLVQCNYFTICSYSKKKKCLFKQLITNNSHINVIRVIILCRVNGIIRCTINVRSYQNNLIPCSAPHEGIRRWFTSLILTRNLKAFVCGAWNFSTCNKK